MQTIDRHTVHALKAAGHYFAAGALDKSIGGDGTYGCHFGMRSSLDIAKSEFKRGYDMATPKASR